MLNIFSFFRCSRNTAESARQGNLSTGATRADLGRLEEMIKELRKDIPQVSSTLPPRSLADREIAYGSNRRDFCANPKPEEEKGATMPCETEDTKKQTDLTALRRDCLRFVQHGSGRNLSPAEQIGQAEIFVNYLLTGERPKVGV